MARTLKITRGAKVKLLRDIKTRGGRTFRAGVVMTVDSIAGCYLLGVNVRAKGYNLQIQKKEARFLLELVNAPAQIEDENGPGTA